MLAWKHFFSIQDCSPMWRIFGLKTRNVVGTLHVFFGIASVFCTISGSGLENRKHSRRDPSRWPRGTLYPQKLVPTSPTTGGRSVGVVRSRTQFFFIFSFSDSVYSELHLCLSHKYQPRLSEVPHTYFVICHHSKLSSISTENGANVEDLSHIQWAPLSRLYGVMLNSISNVFTFIAMLQFCRLFSIKSVYKSTRPDQLPLRERLPSKVSLVSREGCADRRLYFTAKCKVRNQPMCAIENCNVLPYRQNSQFNFSN
jgi:hypothetical protein